MDMLTNNQEDQFDSANQSGQGGSSTNLGTDRSCPGGSSTNLTTHLSQKGQGDLSQTPDIAILLNQANSMNTNSLGSSHAQGDPAITAGPGANQPVTPQGSSVKDLDKSTSNQPSNSEISLSNPPNLDEPNGFFAAKPNSVVESTTKLAKTSLNDQQEQARDTNINQDSSQDISSSHTNSLNRINSVVEATTKSAKTLFNSQQEEASNTNINQNNLHDDKDTFISDRLAYEIEKAGKSLAHSDFSSADTGNINSSSLTNNSNDQVETPSQSHPASTPQANQKSSATVEDTSYQRNIRPRLATSDTPIPSNQHSDAASKPHLLSETLTPAKAASDSTATIPNTIEQATSHSLGSCVLDISEDLNHQEEIQSNHKQSQLTSFDISTLKRDVRARVEVDSTSIQSPQQSSEKKPLYASTAIPIYSKLMAALEEAKLSNCWTAPIAIQLEELASKCMKTGNAIIQKKPLPPKDEVIMIPDNEDEDLLTKYGISLQLFNIDNGQLNPIASTSQNNSTYNVTKGPLGGEENHDRLVDLKNVALENKEILEDNHDTLEVSQTEVIGDKRKGGKDGFAVSTSPNPTCEHQIHNVNDICSEPNQATPTNLPDKQTQESACLYDQACDQDPPNTSDKRTEDSAAINDQDWPALSAEQTEQSPPVDDQARSTLSKERIDNSTPMDNQGNQSNNQITNSEGPVEEDVHQINKRNL
ncbi:uncharacterized protein MELLADRAFT_88381 [Melampsora larici-populina 98AG31]|uniref:Uncharacterized protein n=1 Tax=Melampsora larici-populina (strain 98AG31 / pathotype 3-4-7) TaxID=747676 RepID=F4RRI6_MELLP|nr:uncharacterized protein MELLADRAFT_88381 [Melampsora larici-populina 98AG31]EGG05022.1 hypothetical protein MELLADRAFT_88381 [Melampsora larici-populina 98AG31]